MTELLWTEHHPGAITICDAAGIIVYMNRTAIQLFEESGGEKLIGSNVLDCHPAASRGAVKKLLENEGTAVFTVEKDGVKRLIYDAPWYSEGKFSGLVEISFLLPGEMKNFV